MKDKKIRASLEQAQEAVEQANKARNDAMLELDDDELDAVTGAGGPFNDLPRIPTQPLDPTVRENG